MLLFFCVWQYTTVYIKSSQTAGCSPSWHRPTNKTFSPIAISWFHVGCVTGMSINMCLVKGHVSKEKRWSKRARGSATVWEKEIFLPSLHVKLELLLRQTGSQKIYTHKHASNLTCAGSIRHLSDFSQAHSCTHTPATITHSLHIPDGAFSHPVKMGNCCWGTSTTDRSQLCFSSWVSWVCTRERSCFWTLVRRGLNMEECQS